VLVIGCGFAGMLTAIELKARGFDDVRMVDRAGDFGGTWYWNRYPGCMCDVESYTYLPLLEETGYMPTEKYASAVEIFSYAQLVGRHYDLYPHALFHTEVVEAVWDEADAAVAGADQLGRHTQLSLPGDRRGILHKAKLPGIAGISRFKGGRSTPADGTTTSPAGRPACSWTSSPTSGSR
jgi:cation diffusion facilitator CzcD-associated flavoprotein CzcO